MGDARVHSWREESFVSLGKSPLHNQLLSQYLQQQTHGFQQTTGNAILLHCYKCQQRTVALFLEALWWKVCCNLKVGEHLMSYTSLAFITYPDCHIPSPRVTYWGARENVVTALNFKWKMFLACFICLQPCRPFCAKLCTKNEGTV